MRVAPPVPRSVPAGTWSTPAPLPRLPLAAGDPLAGDHGQQGHRVAVSVVFGLQNGLNIVSNQTAMYAQAPAHATGAAAGLLRTAMYLGAIASASLIGLCFGRQASDAGLHHLALILTIGSAALLVNAFVRQ